MDQSVVVAVERRVRHGCTARFSVAHRSSWRTIRATKRKRATWLPSSRPGLSVAASAGRWCG
ncbi:hypothetical protein GBAR_LOCUS8958 [Geodia barretti]|uniref:Uncharacterized protein n=1 Tax=Geodia barretti TaxID=519541 RepID=A0AA35WEI4_GEOBA|nr:hypothetical protein GBAR_LOCUS8958 [Geodia barretti]